MPRLIVLLLVLAAQLPAQVTAEQLTAGWKTLPLQDGTELTYKLGLPDDFDPQRTYPALLALPPGSQTREMVEASWPRYWGEQAGRAGWIIVSPVAPEGQSFYDGGEAALPELLQQVHATFHVEHGRVHLAGVSNGGRSAFLVATEWPDQFLSLTVLPGFPPSEGVQDRLDVLAGMPVTMHAGGDDSYWVDRMHATARALGALGITVAAHVHVGEGHTPPSLDGDVIMDQLQDVRAQIAAQAPDEADSTDATATGATSSALGTTRVFVVRHADRQGSDDTLSAAGFERAAALARLLEPTALDAIYATQYERTQQTVAPTAKAQGLVPNLLDARDDVAAHLLAEHPGQTLLVAGHSNTVPEILRRLGVEPAIELSEDRYGDLFVVTLRCDRATMLRLRY